MSNINSGKPEKEELELQNALPCMNIFVESIKGSSNVNIYSVDCMFAYNKIFKPKVLSLEMNESLYKDFLSRKAWDFKVNNKSELISPLEVINNPNIKEFAYHIKRIKFANLKYPIIMYIKNNNMQIIDGYHRLSKMYMKGSKTISYIAYDDKLMDKFLFMENVDESKPYYATIENLITEFFANFCPQAKNII